MRFGKQGLVYHGDCLDMLRKVRKESVDLIFADPPFNIKYQYDEYKDDCPRTVFLEWCEKWTSWCSHALKPTGSIFVAIGDDYAADIRAHVLDQRFARRNWIIWHYTFGVYCKGKFGRDHTHVLYYTKDPKKFTFNADAILVPSARQTKYNDKRAVSKGRIPGDVWQFPRVCGTFKERTDHPCQMPEAILERIVKVASNEGDLVLDPFCGSGTTAAVCAKLNRRFITSEISRGYADSASRRIARALFDKA